MFFFDTVTVDGYHKVEMETVHVGEVDHNFQKVKIQALLQQSKSLKRGDIRYVCTALLYVYVCKLWCCESLLYLFMYRTLQVTCQWE